jgi:carbonic anhydrase
MNMQRPTIFDHLIKGYQEFHAQYYQGSERKLFQRLTRTGQNPKIMMVGCSDSRVDPSVIFSSDPGELFVVRNVANLVPPCDDRPHHHATSSALEFAVRFLKVEHIILLGHSQCGGIRALIEQPKEMGQDVEHSFILQWMEIASTARCAVEHDHGDLSVDAKAHLCEKKSLEVSYQNLQTFPWIQEAVAEERLNLHAWHFDIPTGKISVYDPGTAEFTDLMLGI